MKNLLRSKKMNNLIEAEKENGNFEKSKLMIDSEFEGWTRGYLIGSIITLLASTATTILIKKSS